jgi:hypothetical protein
MRAEALVLLTLLLPAPRQDSPDLLKSCEALYDPLTSLRPDVRAKAHAELVKLTAGKHDLLKTPVLPSPQIVLALLGDAAAGKEAAKVVAEEQGPLTRVAVEALGHVATDPSADRLFKLLDSEDFRLALAAARALGRVKNPAHAQALAKLAEQIDNPRRKVLAAYALAPAEPAALATIVNQADAAARPVREVAWAALANLPAAVEEVRRRLMEKDGVQTWSLLFEAQASDEVRDAFGRLLVRAGLYVGPDLVDLGTHKIKEVSAWARAASLDPDLLRRSVLIASLLKRLAAYENEPDLTKDPIPWLEATLAAQGIKGEGDKLKDRLESARQAWERTRPSVLDKDINASIDAGVAQLKLRQDGTGFWKYCVCGAQKNDVHNNGTTALCIYTLLKADVPVRDKSVTLGLDWLLAQPLPNHTYTVGLQAMAFAEAIELLSPPPKSKAKIPPDDLGSLNKYLPRLRDCVTWLAEAQTHVNRGGYESGDWDYAKPPQANMDNSNTQFAVLGLRAAQNAGVAAPAVTWVRALNHWANDQNKDGSWPYRRDRNNPNPGGSRSMSAAGLYCSLVAKATLKRKAPETLVSEDPFKKGLEYFKKNNPIYEFGRLRHPGHVFSPYYDLYSLERAMMISKTERLGDRDWYRDGAAFILANQGPDGEWIDTTDTCFAILFLKRAFVAVATGDNR